MTVNHQMANSFVDISVKMDHFKTSKRMFNWDNCWDGAVKTEVRFSLLRLAVYTLTWLQSCCYKPKFLFQETPNWKGFRNVVKL